MKKIYLIDIEGTNTANIKYTLQDYFRIVPIKNSKEVDEENPNIIMPGNGSFGYYVSFLKKNKWGRKLYEIINKRNSGKLFCICSGFQVLGINIEESSSIEGLNLINYSFHSLSKTFSSDLIINIGRKKIFILEEGLKFNDLEFNKEVNIDNLMNPYFVHGYAAKLNQINISNQTNYCYLYTKVNDEKILSGLISDNFCATQFHPELSGRFWKEFMIRFFK